MEKFYYMYIFSCIKGVLNFDTLQFIGLFLLLRRDFRYNPEYFFSDFLLVVWKTGAKKREAKED